jgi:SAM-dependent methyltransferase
MLVMKHETRQSNNSSFPMLRSVIYAVLEQKLNRAYGDRLAALGPTPKGVFWRNESTQIARFDSLLNLIITLTPVANPMVADVGCGYGGMLNFIQKTPRYQNCNYIGIDINRAMINVCKQNFPHQKRLFFVGKHPTAPVDFCVFSGTFNLCHATDSALWLNYIFANLQQCWKRSRYGLVLNLLCGPRTEIKKQIFYVERQTFITTASQLFGPTHARTTPHVTGDVTFLIAKQ